MSMAPLRRFEAPLFLFQLLDLTLARAIEAAALDERHDRVQLAGVEERAVPLAHVDDGAREPAEVEAVHHLSAGDALAVADLFGAGGTQGMRPLVQHRPLRLAAGAHVLERLRVDPHPAAALAFEQRRVADVDVVHYAAARRARRLDRRARRPRAPRAAGRAVGRPLEHQRETGR